MFKVSISMRTLRSLQIHLRIKIGHKPITNPSRVIGKRTLNHMAGGIIPVGPAAPSPPRDLQTSLSTLSHSEAVSEVEIAISRDLQ